MFYTLLLHWPFNPGQPGFTWLGEAWLTEAAIRGQARWLQPLLGNVAIWQTPHRLRGAVLWRFSDAIEIDPLSPGIQISRLDAQGRTHCWWPEQAAALAWLQADRPNTLWPDWPKEQI